MQEISFESMMLKCAVYFKKPQKTPQQLEFYAVFQHS